MRKLDSIDRQLISLLMKDGRAPAVLLARKLGVDARTVRTRLEALQRAGVVRIAAIAQPEAVGLPVIADVHLQVEAGLQEEVARRLAQNSFVSYVAFPIGGGSQVDLQVRCRNHKELGQLLNETFPQIPGIRHVMFNLIHRIVKDVYDWDIPDTVGQDD